MSKTWDEADSKGKINCQIEFINQKLKSTQNNESSSENYSIRKENGKEILSPEDEESVYITRYKNGFKLAPLNDREKKNIIILEPHK